MKRSVMILALLLSFAIPKSYSQSIKLPLLQEINLRLAEGIEAKRLLAEKSHQVKLLDSLINHQADEIDIQNKQILLLRENARISEAQARTALNEVAICMDAKEQDHKDAVRLRKARNRYAWIVGIETAVLAGIVYLMVK